MAQIILAILATWRLTSLLVYEEGPADIFARLRKSLARSRLKGLLDCFWCASLWVSAPVAFLACWPDLQLVVLAWLGFSTGAILLDELISRHDKIRGGE